MSAEILLQPLIHLSNFLLSPEEPEQHCSPEPRSKTCLFSQGQRYKRTCFTLMAYAFLNNTSCSKCKCLWMCLYLFFFYISSLFCVLQSGSALSDPLGAGCTETFPPILNHASHTVCVCVFQLYIHVLQRDVQRDFLVFRGASPSTPLHAQVAR